MTSTKGERHASAQAPVPGHALLIEQRQHGDQIQFLGQQYEVLRIGRRIQSAGAQVQAAAQQPHRRLLHRHHRQRAVAGLARVQAVAQNQVLDCRALAEFFQVQPLTRRAFQRPEGGQGEGQGKVGDGAAGQGHAVDLQVELAGACRQARRGEAGAADKVHPTPHLLQLGQGRVQRLGLQPGIEGQRRKFKPGLADLPGQIEAGGQAQRAIGDLWQAGGQPGGDNLGGLFAAAGDYQRRKARPRGAIADLDRLYVQRQRAAGSALDDKAGGVKP